MYSGRNRVKRMLKEGRVVIGVIVSEVRTPFLGPMLDAAGLHFVILDTEHGSYNNESIADIIAGCHGLTITPFVKISELRRECFLKPLDAGALGVLVPQVETREEAELCVQYSKYAPEGKRGISLRRAHTGFKRVNAAQFTIQANEDAMIMVQIETAKAIQNIDSILSVPSLDVAFVGPSDLSHSLGVEADLSNPELAAAIKKIIEAGRKYGVATGIHTYSPSAAIRLADQGLQFISCNTDVGALIDTFSNSVSNFRKAFGDRIP